jgi:spermidine/putrescine transport system ATP-binding protein
MTAAVSIQNVSKRYGPATALDRVSLEIEAGEFVVLLGPSGCGKTTLLNLIGGFAEPTAGTILIGTRDMAGVALRMRGVEKPRRTVKAEAMLALVGLEGRDDRRPHELSGGQRQRVALARALAVEPQVLLLDEPLGALDLKLRRQMQDELKAIQRRVGTTFVHVTHDQEEAMAIADRIVVMNAGRIEDHGPPRQVYLHPKTLFTASFMGELNRIPVVNGRAPFGAVPVPDGTLCLRPEAISQKGSLHIGLCMVQDVAFFGTHIRAHVTPLTAPDLRLVVHLPQSAVPEVGTMLDLGAESHVVLTE